MTARIGLLLAALVLIAAALIVVYVAAPRGVGTKAERPASPTDLRAQPVPSPPGQTTQIVTRGLREGEAAPEFTAPRFGGGTLSLKDLRGKGIVMNFFASWCPPCRAEARDLEAMFRKYRDLGIVFLGVDIEQDTWDDALAFLREFGISYPTVRDETSDIARKYRLTGLPSTYFIDKNGVIRSKFIGAFLGPEGLTLLESRIEAVLPQGQ